MNKFLAAVATVAVLAAPAAVFAAESSQSVRAATDAVWWERKGRSGC